MLNLEKYKEEIMSVSENGEGFALIGCRVVACGSIKCSQCAFFCESISCIASRVIWLYEEYKEPEIDWSKVPVDTKILVSNSPENNDWHKRYFARLNSEGQVMAWGEGKTSFSARGWEDVTCWRSAKLYEE